MAAGNMLIRVGEVGTVKWFLRHASGPDKREQPDAVPRIPPGGEENVSKTTGERWYKDLLKTPLVDMET